MQRIPMNLRANLPERIEQFKFDFHMSEGMPYWDESAAYIFDTKEVEEIEQATDEIWTMCLDLVGEVSKDDRLLTQLAIPEAFWPMIAESTRRQDDSLYGRMDFRYDGLTPPKLLEFNADTPTSLYEAAVFQWVWLQDQNDTKWRAKPHDQFNSLHDKLLARFQALFLKGEGLHLAFMPDNPEDKALIVYLEDCAKQAGIETRTMFVDEISLSVEDRFIDGLGSNIVNCFKLYPWEWIVADDFGKNLSAIHATRWLEPPWKMILSNKGILPLLHERYPHHPNILPAFFEADPRKEALGSSFAKKPIFSREGANVLLVDNGNVVRQEGVYGSEGYIRQALCKLPEFDGNYPVIGSWLIGDEPAGMTIREDTTLITNNASRFVPHAISP